MCNNFTLKEKLRFLRERSYTPRRLHHLLLPSLFASSSFLLGLPFLGLPFLLAIACYLRWRMPLNTSRRLVHVDLEPELKAEKRPDFITIVYQFRTGM